MNVLLTDITPNQLIQEQINCFDFFVMNIHNDNVTFRNSKKLTIQEYFIALRTKEPVDVDKIQMVFYGFGDKCEDMNLELDDWSYSFNKNTLIIIPNDDNTLSPLKQRWISFKNLDLTGAPASEMYIDLFITYTLNNERLTQKSKINFAQMRISLNIAYFWANTYGVAAGSEKFKLRWRVNNGEKVRLLANGVFWKEYTETNAEIEVEPIDKSTEYTLCAIQGEKTVEQKLTIHSLPPYIKSFQLDNKKLNIEWEVYYFTSVYIDGQQENNFKGTKEVDKCKDTNSVSLKLKGSMQDINSVLWIPKGKSIPYVNNFCATFTTFLDYDILDVTWDTTFTALTLTHIDESRLIYNDFSINKESGSWQQLIYNEKTAVLLRGIINNKVYEIYLRRE